jgi:hypothetical protein
MAEDRHKEGYYRDYAERYPDKAREKSRRQAEKLKQERHLEWELTRPRCLVCGKPFAGRALNSPVTKACMVHQRCNPAVWMAAKRAMEK